MKNFLLLSALLAGGAISPMRASEEAAFTLSAARAELVASSHSQPLPLTSADGQFDRIYIREKETIRLRITLPALLANREVSITAPNGGKLQRSGNAPLNFTPKASAPLDLDLEFTPASPGAYTIEIRQGGALLTLDLWSGEQPPAGESGPAYDSAKP